MKPSAAAISRNESATDLLILPDGRILAHNLSPAIARLLAELNPGDAEFRLRAALPLSPAPEQPATVPAP